MHGAGDAPGHHPTGTKQRELHGQLLDERQQLQQQAGHQPVHQLHGQGFRLRFGIERIQEHDRFQSHQRHPGLSRHPRGGHHRGRLHGYRGGPMPDQRDGQRHRLHRGGHGRRGDDDPLGEPLSALQRRLGGLGRLAGELLQYPIQRHQRGLDRGRDLEPELRGRGIPGTADRQHHGGLPESQRHHQQHGVHRRRFVLLGHGGRFARHPLRRASADQDRPLPLREHLRHRAHGGGIHPGGRRRVVEHQRGGALQRGERRLREPFQFPEPTQQSRPDVRALDGPGRAFDHL